MERTRALAALSTVALATVMAGLVGCASTYRPTATQAAQYEAQAREAREREARQRQQAEQWANFYETNPILRSREKCVGRTLSTLTDKSWPNLAQRATSFCVVPPPPLENPTAWVRVADAENDRRRGVYIDLARIEAREQHQATFWELVEAFDDNADFVLGRYVADCDRKLLMLVESTSIISGHYKGASATPSPTWQSVLPNSAGEATMIRVCAARAALLKPSRPRTRPQPQPVRGTRPKAPATI